MLYKNVHVLKKYLVNINLNCTLIYYLYCRSLEDINLVMEFAKLDKSEVKPSIQSIYFSEKLDNDAIKLMEVDNCILDTIKVGDE